LNTLTLQLPSNIEKEAKAKKEITKLLLFHICGKLSNDSTSFGDPSYPESAQGMRVVLDSAQPAPVTGFSNLIRNTCVSAKELDLMNIRSRLISIMFINKATALHLLQGNLATEGVNLLNNKANSINLSLFLPQQIDRNCNVLPLSLDDLLNYTTLMLKFCTNKLIGASPFLSLRVRTGTKVWYKKSIPMDWPSCQHI
jgi:hypothetical protein